LGCLHAEAFASAGCDVVLVSDSEEILQDVDVVAVASPAELRFHHTALALEHGLDVLVEQPVAPTVENARMLERMAGLRPVRPVVQVSQPDRFNPAAHELQRLIADRKPVAIAFRRIGCGEMLHDVHTLVALARSPLVRLHASGGTRYAVATLVFESGLIGTLAAGQAGPGPVHEIVATTEDAVIAVDAVAGSVEVSRGDVRERRQIDLGDPYLAQAESFLEAVRTRGAPAVTLRTATACLEVADSVRECLAVQAAATGTGDALVR
jgi:predicted dehydrogenase